MTMRLSIFTFHVSQIMTMEVGGKATFHPCNGVSAEVVVEKATDGFPSPAWDSIRMNGVIVGNRQGGVKAFTNLVNNAKPQIEYT